MALLTICLALFVPFSLFRFFQKFTKAELGYIPGPPSDSFMKGVFPKLFNPNAWDYHRYIWDTYGPVARVKGMFGQNMLYVYDPKALDHIFVKDHHVYLHSPNMLAATGLLLGRGIAATVAGPKHKKQKKLMVPAFSTGNMCQITPTLYNIVHRMESSVLKTLNEGDEATKVEMHSWVSRVTLEAMGQCAFGYSFDDLGISFKEHEFTANLRKLVPVSYKLSFLRVYATARLEKLASPASWRKIIDILPFPALRDARHVADILHQTALDIYQVKKKALLEGDKEVTEQVGRGTDILAILMRANLEADEEDRMTEEELHGQISSLTFGGMDTTANCVGRILWVLSRNQDAQRKLRDEIRKGIMQDGGDMSYDTVTSLPYLDAVCKETLRVHSATFQMLRQPIRDIVLPISKPLRCEDGREVTEIFVPKGTNLLCNIQASNSNKEVWGPDAHEWKPERWLQGTPQPVIDAHVPGVYAGLMTFSAGNRACLGFKFAQIEMKVILSVLISRFEFSPSSDEIEWRMAGIVSPVVVGSTKVEPQLPLMVKLAA